MRRGRWWIRGGASFGHRWPFRKSTPTSPRRRRVGLLPAPIPPFQRPSVGDSLPEHSTSRHYPLRAAVPYRAFVPPPPLEAAGASSFNRPLQLHLRHTSTTNRWLRTCWYCSGRSPTRFGWARWSVLSPSAWRKSWNCSPISSFPQRLPKICSGSMPGSMAAARVLVGQQRHGRESPGSRCW